MRLYSLMSIQAQSSQIFPRARTNRALGTAIHALGDALLLGREGIARQPLGWMPRGHDAHRLLPATRINVFETD
jgi:hypothetical protein